MRIVKLCSVLLFGLLLAACASNKAADGGVGTGGLGIQPGFSTEGLTKDQILKHQAVFFDYDKTDIKPEYTSLIESHAQYLAAHPKQAVLLTGNTDVRGSREYNLGLGQRRAQSVADVLMANGVVTDQIVKVSYGAEVPLSCEKTEAGYALNRRVDILYCEATDCQRVAKNYAKNICTFNQ